MNLGFQLVHHLSITYIAPPPRYSQPTHRVGVIIGPDAALGGLLCFGPVIGIMTTLEEWVFARFMADNSHFHRDHR